MKAVKKDVFDINKVTVVGSPTITSDGVASGLQANNYVETSNTISIAEKTIIKFSYNISSKTATNSVYFLTLPSTRLSIYKAGTGYFSIVKNTTYGSILSPSAYQLGVVDFELVLENNTATCFISQNGVVLGNILLSDVNYTGDTKVRLGADMAGTFGATSGETIDLNAFKIYVDGELVYSPTRPTMFLERRKEGFDLSKFTVVGSPTITEDGVASGFDGNSLIKIPHEYTVNDNIKFSFKINGGTSGIPFTGFIDNTSKSLFYFNKVSATRIITVFRNTSLQTLFERTFDIPVQEVVVSCNITKSSLSLFFNGIEITFVNNDFSSFIDGFNNLYSLCIGDNQIFGNLYFNGQIDLPYTSITVDGKEVFTGAKEKFYAIGD